MPFFIFDNPFRKFLIALAKSDGKLFALLNRVKVGEALGLEIVNELIESNIIYIVNSREKPFKVYNKQLIKKEYKNYTIEPKIYFTKPFFRFWFLFVEPYRDRGINIDMLLDNIKSREYLLSSLVFEQLSIELLKSNFNNIVEISSYWDINSEFDIYAKLSNKEFILGECKYKNKPINRAELIKLKYKAVTSNLRVDRYALFSKSGFSNELKKLNSNDLLLYELEDFKRLIDI